MTSEQMQEIAAQHMTGSGMNVEAFARAIIAAEHEELRKQEPVTTVTNKNDAEGLEMSWWIVPALPVGTKLYARAAPIPEPTPSQQENPKYSEFETWWSKEFPALDAECYESEMRVAISAWNASRVALLSRPDEVRP